MPWEVSCRQRPPVRAGPLTKALCPSPIGGAPGCSMDEAGVFVSAGNRTRTGPPSHVSLAPLPGVRDRAKERPDTESCNSVQLS